MSLIGRILRVLNSTGAPFAFAVVLARYDVSRRQFTVRSLHTRHESTITAEELARGLRSNTLRLEDR